MARSGYYMIFSHTNTVLGLPWLRSFITQRTPCPRGPAVDALSLPAAGAPCCISPSRVRHDSSLLLRATMQRDHPHSSLAVR